METFVSCAVALKLGMGWEQAYDRMVDEGVNTEDLPKLRSLCILVCALMEATARMEAGQ
ncbi:MAG: hypothetical protein ACOVQH_06220 [Burkholderiaceae bacterium]